MDVARRAIKNTKILVTGGAGFIGSSLCADLLAHGNDVTCLDNFSTGKKENVAELIEHPSFHLVEGDIRSPDDCRKSAQGKQLVLHHAALGSVPRSFHDPATTNAVNIDGFLNMIAAAADAGVQRFVFASSSSVYGDTVVTPKIEEVLGAPLSPYAVTKRTNELYAAVFAHAGRLEVVGLRYFNVFGRRQDPDGAYAAAIPRFILHLMRHESPVINGDGTHSRDFTFVDNVVAMNHLAATAEGMRVSGHVFNTAGGRNTDLNTLASLLKKELCALDPAIGEVPLTYGPERAGDVPHSHASIEKARVMLGYEPSHSLESGLQETVRWYWNRFSERL